METGYVTKKTDPYTQYVLIDGSRRMRKLKLKGLTTAERDALSVSSTDRAIIYNNTTGRPEQWNGTAWGALDHGHLAGLTDDDHTQYLKEEASGGAASEVPDHTHQSTGECAKLDHGAALDGLSDDDHTQYVLHTDVDDTPVDGVTTDPVSSNWAYDHAANASAHHTQVGLTVAETEVFADTFPTSWTDLDLSGTVGSNYALVILKVRGGTATTEHVYIRQNGDSEINEVMYGTQHALGTTTTEGAYVIVPTDSGGIVEIISTDGSSGTVDIVAYIK